MINKEFEFSTTEALNREFYCFDKLIIADIYLCRTEKNIFTLGGGGGGGGGGGQIKIFFITKDTA